MYKVTQNLIPKVSAFQIFNATLFLCLNTFQIAHYWIKKRSLKKLSQRRICDGNTRRLPTARFRNAEICFQSHDDSN